VVVVLVYCHSIGMSEETRRSGLAEVGGLAAGGFEAAVGLAVA